MLRGGRDIEDNRQRDVASVVPYGEGWICFAGRWVIEDRQRTTGETPLLGEMSAKRTEGWAVSGEERPYGVDMLREGIRGKAF